MLYREAGDFKTSYRDDSQTFPLKLDRWGYWIVLAIAFLVVPFVITDYWANSVLVPFLIYAIAALGLNILTGYAGQLSLGTAAFMAVGAYAAYNFQLRIEGIPVLPKTLRTDQLVGALDALLDGRPPGADIMNEASRVEMLRDRERRRETTDAMRRALHNQFDRALREPLPPTLSDTVLRLFRRGGA